MSEISWREKFIPVERGMSLEDYGGRKGSILVVAPHPDDDVLGVGGTMAGASAQGKAVFSIYITDGRGGPRKDQSISDEEMAVLRQKEAIVALKAVGAGGGFFLQKQSSQLEGEMGKKTEGDLVEIFQGINPQEVFLPAPYERHRTHQRCTRLIIEALRAAVGVKPTLLGYSLWGCFWGKKRRVVRDISPFIKKKVEAVLAHSSQIAYKNYPQGILGKNNCEAIFWESHEPQKMAFAEILLDMTEFLEEKELTLERFIRRDFEDFIQAFL